MIKISKVSSEDIPLWDNYVKSHPNATPYHLTAYTQTIAHAYLLNSINLIAKVEGVVVGILPICIFKSITLQKSFYSLPYCDTGACLSNNNEISQLLITKSEELLTLHNIKTWQYQDTASINEIKNPTVNFLETDKVRMILPLPKTSKDLFDNLKSKLRSQIRKAQKNQLHTEVNLPQGIQDFYLVYCRNMRDLGSPPHSLTWFETLNKSFKKDINIVVIKHNQQPIAAGIQLISGGNCSIPWASSLREHNNLNANMLLYWNLLELAVDSQCSFFDFGRSTFGGNTFKFKKQWGALPLTLRWQQKGQISLPTKNNNISLTRKLLATCWSIMPIPLSNWLGAKVRKFIAL